MANAAKDNNKVSAITGVLNTNGTTVSRIEIDPTTHVLDINDGVTGSDFGADLAARDANSVPVLIAVSEVDGVTPVPVYVDSDGKLLIDTT